MTGETIELHIAGQSVRVTNPDKVFFSSRGETKLDLINYYLKVAEPLLEALGGRPTLMQRFPDGASGKSFFQKRVPKGAPEWLHTTTVQTVNGTPSNALVLDDMAHVAWAVNMGCLGFHQWPYKATTPGISDELRIDLDPMPGTTFEMVSEGALETRALLSELGVVAWLKTSGSRGLHVCSPNGTRPRSDLPRWRSLASSSVVGPTCSRQLGGKKSVASGSSWTSTRTRHTRPCSARGPYAAESAPRFPHRCNGRRSTRSIPMNSPSTPSLTGWRRMGIRGTTRRIISVTSSR